LSTRKTASPRKSGRNSDIVGRKTDICTLQKARSIGVLDFAPLLPLDEPFLIVVQSSSPNGIPPSHTVRTRASGLDLMDSVDSPLKRNDSPSKGDRSSFRAERSPSKGERLLFRGKRSPSKGSGSPSRGGRLPSKGERLPSKGEPFLRKGGRLPSKGESTRSKGGRLRSEESLALKGAEASSSLTTEFAPKGGWGVCPG
jgi:hypothetical protein